MNALTERLVRAYRRARPHGRPTTVFLPESMEEEALYCPEAVYPTADRGMRLGGWNLVFTPHVKDLEFWIERTDLASVPQTTEVLWREA